MLETIFATFLIEGAIIVIIALICRSTGTKLPAWVRPKFIADFINRLIEPSPKRFEAIFIVSH